MSHLKSIVAIMGRFLSHHGGWGLFFVSYLDSSFLAFPFINDLLLIKLSSLHPAKALLYTLECTAGSVFGAYTIYYLSHAGSRRFSRRTSPKEKSRVQHWIERNDFLSLLLASLLPPPMPFKIFPIIAGGLRTNGTRFILALLIGRGIRFAFESWLGIHYGAAAQLYLRKNIVAMSAIMIAVVSVVALIYRRLKGQSVQSTYD
ncbi:MAG TPA: VTT domain-containing protein [Terriglobia bacterium]|nr:VTT domain-containing protein [Terriglobia bacterium]